MPPKRKAPTKQASKGKAKQPKQDGQKAVTHELKVPLDEGFSSDGKALWPEAQWQHRVPE